MARAVGVIAGLLCGFAAWAQSSFPYAGVLRDGPAPANGLYDFEFRLFDDLAPGEPDRQVGPANAFGSVGVSCGQFTVTLDFGKGAAAQTGGRYLDIRVRPAGAGAFTQLAPRQDITGALGFGRSAARPGAMPDVPEGPLLTWEQVPLTYPEPGTPQRALFDRVWGEARSRTVRVAVLGDSQETVGAAGDVYIHALQGAFGALYGNIPETPFTCPGSAGGGAPATQYVGLSYGQESPMWLPSNLFPPGVIPRAFTSNAYGALFQLLHDQAQSRRAAGLVNTRFFDPSGRVDLQVLAMRADIPCGQVRVVVAPQDDPRCSFFAQPVDVRVTDDPLLAAGGRMEPHVYTFENIARGERKYHQVYVKGDDPARRTVIVGARFVNATDPRGVTITPLSAGGYTAGRWLTQHASCGPVLGALGFDVYMITLGVNDAFSVGQSAAVFRVNLEALINLVRGASPEARIILRVDPAATDRESAEYDRYAGVAKALADRYPLVLVLNHRRALDMLGHNAANDAGAGLTPRGVWAPFTPYFAGDYVIQYPQSAFPKYWRCIESHASGSYDFNGPGTAGGHSKWVPWRWYALADTDTDHYNDQGQARQAWLDALLITGGR